METTLNIHVDIFRLINSAAKARGISRSDLIVTLLKKVMDDIANPSRLGKLVQYQEKSMPCEWRTFHVSLREDDYEYFLDLRKLLKMSVSLILAYAVKKYLKRIMNKNITDNYLFKNYVLAKMVIDNIVCWKLIWGYPPDITKFITFD
ncbi:MAG: hypothetical protein KA369_22180 [Spirochaetes bacterium]|nr:hypothetical protein [Spirochaetota bacterium]